MSYVFKGRLCGYVCEKCDEPLAGVKVRLYRAEADDKLAARAVADPRESNRSGRPLTWAGVYAGMRVGAGCPAATAVSVSVR